MKQEELLKLARMVADAAVFFDFAKGALVASERVGAREHVEALHDVAMALAGDRVKEVYGPEEVTC